MPPTAPCCASTVSAYEAVRIPRVGGAPAALAFGGGSLWVADSDSRDVVQVDPGANKVVLTVRGGQRAVIAGLTPTVSCGLRRASMGGVRRIGV